MSKKIITGEEPIHAVMHADGTHKGITLKQHIAIEAMNGLLMQQAPVDRILNEAGNNKLISQIAKAAVMFADELIQEFNKPL